MQQRPKPQTELVTAALARGALDADSQGGGIGTGHLLAFLSLCPAVVSQPGEWSVRMPVRCRVGGVMGLGCAPRQVVLPGLHEMALAAHGWFPSAECVRCGRTAPAFASRRVSPRGYDKVQRRGLKPGWNLVEPQAAATPARRR